MTTILGANSVVASGFDVDNSVRFNRADGAYMHKTPGSAGNRKTWTFSCWAKKSDIAAHSSYFGANQTFQLEFHSTGAMLAWESAGDFMKTNALYRDTSSWYHIVWAFDTTQGTAANRVKLYVNGIQITSWATSNYPDEDAEFDVNNDEPQYVGDYHSGSSENMNGYLAEVVFIDGLALAADQFGEFDEDSGIWKPIDVSGLTFGTNGFYLDFEASDNLGNDVNGGTDLTEVNLAATDQSVDTCTNNQCVLNGVLLPNSQPATFTQGNTTITQNSNWRSYAGTFGLTSGKWYFEADGSGTAGTVLYGIASLEAIQLQNSGNSNLNYTIGLNKPAYAYHGSSGGMYHSTSSSNAQGQGGGSWGAAFNSSDLISVYIDLDNNKLYTAKNNTMNDSGTGYDIEAGFTYFPVVIAYAVTNTALNFGNGDFNGTAVSSAVADVNGFGRFEYDPSRGGGSDFDSAAKDFLCINSKNLSTVNS